MYIYIYVYIFIYIYVYDNLIGFITKVVDIIHKQESNLYQNEKQIKFSYQAVRV